MEGIEDGWNIYLEECELFFCATPPKDRHLVASKLARRLTGSARTAIRGLRPRDFAGTQGIPKLLRLLQGRIGDLPIPDLANKLDEFIFRLKRTPGESMNEWGLRSIESYRKLQVALDRDKGKKADLGDYNYEYDEDKTQDRERGKGSRFPWPKEWAKGDDDEEPLETEEELKKSLDGERTVQEHRRQTHRTRKASEASPGPDPRKPDHPRLHP